MTEDIRGRRVRGRGKWRGQALVEFALIVPLFLASLFGVLDGARLVYMNSVVSQGAREGARLGAVEAAWIGSTDPSCGHTGGPVCPASFAAFKADVVAAVNREVAPFASVLATRVYIECTTYATVPTGSWTGSSCANHTANSATADRADTNVVTVRIEMEYRALTPIVGNLIPPTWLSGSATMVIN